MRLDKLIAHMGFGSRKEVKEYIRKGYVSVNGEVIKNDDFKVDEEHDEIVFLDQELSYQKLSYFILNKPDGYVSATYDSKDPTVLDLIDYKQHRGLFPVGRLDKDTIGLLLITNDGKLAHNLLAPNKHVDKVYELTYSGEFKNYYYKCFEEGIVLDDGYKCKPAKIELFDNNRAYITIKEGKYHQVKRMFESLNMKVETLKRIEFGGLKLPADLEQGKYRELTEKELDILLNN